MRLTSSRRRIAAWLGALAIGANTLAPIAPQAAPGDGSTPFEICTAAGLKQIADRETAPGAPSSPHLLSHCALCLSTPGHGALPSSATPVATLPAEGARAPSAAETPPLPASWKLRPRPRAPPLLT